MRINPYIADVLDYEKRKLPVTNIKFPSLVKQDLFMRWLAGHADKGSEEALQAVVMIQTQAARIAELEIKLSTEQEFRYAGEEDLKHVQAIIGASAKLINKYARLRS